jgi:hypothetical protein
VIDDIDRGEIDLSHIFLIEIYWNDYTECFKYFIRRQLRSFVELLFNGGEIDIIVYATVLSVIYNVFRKS